MFAPSVCRSPFICSLASYFMHTMDRFENTWIAVLDAFMRHSQRWQDVDLAMDPMSLLTPRSSQRSCTYPAKTPSATFTSPRRHRRWKIDGFSQAPSLWDFEGVGTKEREPVIPESQLTRYAGGSLDPTTQVKLLCRIPSLTRVTLRMRRVAQTQTITSFPQMSSTNILHLALHGNPLFLDALTLPALQTLDVTYIRGVRPVLSMIQRSSCTLTCLELEARGADIKNTDIMAVFEAAPELTSLSLVAQHTRRESSLSAETLVTYT
jgi:hypothetical protein